MSLLKVSGATNCFDLDFSKIKRKKAFRFRLELGGPPEPVVVDGRAIGEAIGAAMTECPFESVRGRRQPWNDYHLYLCAEDHDDVRRLEGRLLTDLQDMLNERLLKLDADPVGPMNVRILVDDAGSVHRGHGRLWAFHEVAIPNTPKVQGEITIRFDKPVALDTAAGGTDRLGVRLRGPAGEIPLPDGQKVWLGRADSNPQPDHRAIPGADSKINRRQLWVRVIGDQAEIGRDTNANPVSVGGTALAGGGSTVCALPVELDLSNGRMKLTLSR